MYESSNLNHSFGDRYPKYLPFETIDDLVDQYNYVGYHDVCIYPSIKDMVSYRLENRPKGVRFVYQGHSDSNQTGNEWKCYILVNVVTRKIDNFHLENS